MGLSTLVIQRQELMYYVFSIMVSYEDVSNSNQDL
jgi:hypothetical protein